MKTLPIIYSQEYHMNQSSVFTMIDNKYFGCLIYPNSRSYPVLKYWETATSSDSDRGFKIVTKEFTGEEIEKIITLQTAIDALSKLIPNQPKWAYIPKNFKVKRGRAWDEYKSKTDAKELQVKEYFKSIEVFSNALSKAHNDLRSILTK